MAGERGTAGAACNRSEAAPGDQIPNRRSMFDVFDFDWCDVIPPTPDQLEHAWRDLHAQGWPSRAALAAGQPARTSASSCTRNDGVCACST